MLFDRVNFEQGARKVKYESAIRDKVKKDKKSKFNPTRDQIKMAMIDFFNRGGSIKKLEPLYQEPFFDENINIDDYTG